MKALTTRVFLIVVPLAVLLADRADAASREELISEGEQYLTDGNALAAERAFVVGADTYPDDPRFLYYAGIAAYMQGRNGDAVRRLAQIRDGFPRAQFYLGLIALDDDRPLDALAAFDAYLQQFPRDPDAEVLKGLAQLALDNPEAVEHFNLAAQLKRDLLSYALLYRGIQQVKTRDQEGADKALRAVERLNERRSLVHLADQALDLMNRRGDAAKTRWGETYVDVVYDDNLGREFDRNPHAVGFRALIRARYWTDVLDERPRLTIGGYVDHDQPFTGATVAQTAFGALGDLGFYRALARLSIDPGLEFEPAFTLGNVNGSYGASQLAVAVRPRIYLFADHERATKFFYELGYLDDLANGFKSGLLQRFGMRPSWTGFNRRTYVSGLLAIESFAAAAAAYHAFGPHIGLDMQARTPRGFLVEATADYRKLFYGRVTPARAEDVLLAHGGIGYVNARTRLAFVGGADQEHHVNSDRTRSWRVRSYWLRVGSYF